MSSSIKLQKFLATAGVASRRAAEKLIIKGKILVNDQLATLGQRVNPIQDKIYYQNQQIKIETDFKYYLVNKPVGVLTTTTDELDRKTVLALLPTTITQKKRLYPVGRLDKDSEGLLLLTNDGEFTNLLTHPKHLISKTYHVLTDREPSPKALEHLRRGVLLKENLTAPAAVEIQANTDEGTWLVITISEGKNRQVRRMLERVGYQTLRLIRTRFGPYTLDDLQDQKWIETKRRQI